MVFLKKHRLFIFLSFIIAFIDASFVRLSYMQSKVSLHQEEQLQAVNYFSAFDIAYQTTKENMLQISNIIANEKAVQDLFLKGKLAVNNEGGGAGGEQAKVARDALNNIVAGRWQKFSQKFKARQLHFHLGPGSTSFLRVHKPHKFGDNMDTIRHTIVDVNQCQQAVTGFETGRVYSGIRGVSPVFAINEVGEQEHVGAVEAGNSFAIVLDNIASNLYVDAAVLLYEEHLRKNVWPEYLNQVLKKSPPSNGLILEQTTSELIKQLVNIASNSEATHLDKYNINVQSLSLEGKHILYASKPLRDHLGSKNLSMPDAGQIVIWKNNTLLYDALNKNLRDSILYAVFAFLIVELLIFFTIKKISGRLNSIVTEQTVQINLRSYVLEQLLKDYPLTTILDSIIKIIEEENPSMLCSVLLVDKEKKYLYYASAPSLPDFYIQAIHKVKIGAGIGSCGAAAFSKKRVIVGDIQNHPYWAFSKDIAAKAKLSSCWSEPILGSNDILLGTFAIYHHDINTPDQDDFKLIKFASQLAAIAIEQRQADEQLRLSSRVFNDAHEGIIITDTDSIILDVNPAFTQITGYSRAEVLGKTPGVLRSGKHSTEFYTQLWSTLIEKNYWQGEIWNRKKNGDLYEERLTISALKEEGKIQHYVGLFSDITQLKHLENKQMIEHKNVLVRAQISQILQQPTSLKKRLEQVLAILCACEGIDLQNKAGIFILPEGGTRLQAYITHGTFPNDFFLKKICLNLNDCLCGCCAESGLLKVSDNCRGNYENEHTCENMAAHGHYTVPLQYSGTVLGVLFLYTDPYPSRDRAILGMLTNFGSLLGLSIANDRANKALLKEKVVAEKANKAKSEFLSAMSHELRTPLNAILGFGDLLKTDDEAPLNDDQKESLDFIINSGKHLLDLINEILDLSRIDANKVNLLIEPIKLIDVAKECLSLIGSTTEQCTIDITTPDDEQNYVVKADYTRLKQILLNLLSNAIKYNRDNGSVSLNWCKTPDHFIRIEVIDTGIGITLEEQHKVFCAFERLGQESTAIEGTGIGLVVTRNLVEIMGGRIGFESQLGKGSTFWFELPIFNLEAKK